MRSTLLMIALLLATSLMAAPVPNLTLEQGEKVARASIALAFAHGCATFINSPFLVRDGLRLLELAYSGAGLANPPALAEDAYWKIVKTIREGEFGPTGVFDAAACQVVQKVITEAIAQYKLSSHSLDRE